MIELKYQCFLFIKQKKLMFSQQNDNFMKITLVFARQVTISNGSPVIIYQNSLEFHRTTIIILQLNYKSMHRKIVINPQPFIFREVTNQVRQDVKNDNFSLQTAFFMNRPNGPEVFLTLTSNYILVYQPFMKQEQFIFYTELDFCLKFQVIYELDGKIPDDKAIFSNQVGFRLMSQNQQKVQFYARNQPFADVWIRYLSQKINQYGFHKLFKPVQKLGKGGFATVFQIERITDKQHFAVKAFTKKSTIQSQDINHRNNLLKQIQKLRTFTCNNIIKCQAIFQSHNSIYIVLELLRDGQLHTRINKKNASFTAYQIKEFIHGMAVGLKQMHDYRVMHRDIKPQNIMMRGSEGLKPVIADFGLAADVDSEDYIFIRCGTPGYVAPQVVNLQKGQHIEPQCDIFSLGAIFHILLVKRTLFQGKKCQQVYHNNKNMNFNLDKPIYQGVDEKAMDLLRRMLAINPQQRIKAAQILEHPFLSGFIQSENEVISPSSTNGTDGMNFSKAQQAFE